MLRVLQSVSYLVLMVSLLCGCTGKQEPAQPAGPTYAELVMIYNAEQEALDRLERKRKEMVEEYEAANLPQVDPSLQPLTDLLGAAGGLAGDAAATPPSDPNAALDHAVLEAQKAQQVASQMLQSMSQAAAQQNQPQQQIVYSPEFQQQLAAVDAEIAAQKQRVDKAREARDAAEAKKP